MHMRQKPGTCRGSRHLWLWQLMFGCVSRVCLLYTCMCAGPPVPALLFWFFATYTTSTSHSPTAHPLSTAAVHFCCRALITDHGHFVLLNVYVPNAGSMPERARLGAKLAFLAALKDKVDDLLGAGRQVRRGTSIKHITGHPTTQIPSCQKGQWGQGGR